MVANILRLVPVLTWIYAGLAISEMAEPNCSVETGIKPLVQDVSVVRITNGL